MQDPEFSNDLASKIKNEIPAVPAPPRTLSKKKAMDPTAKAFFRSVVLHAFVIVSALLYEAISSRLGWNSDDLNRLKMNELKSAIRVEMIGLPDIKASDLKDVDLSKDVGKNPETPTPETVSPTAMVEPTKQKAEPPKKESSVKEKLKELKDRLTADQKRKEQIAKLLKNKTKTGEGRAALAGNLKSEGNATTGDVAEESDIYVGKALAHLKRHWNMPAWASRSSYKARLVVKISPSGKVIFKMLTKSSGSNDFDQAVTRAVDNADPFPMPPDALRLQVLKDGIEFGFPD